ncbi:hypothetical protein ACXN5S_04685 [Pseudoroseicyclus sp. H15]
MRRLATAASLALALAGCVQDPPPDVARLNLQADVAETGPHGVTVELRLTNGTDARICITEPPASDPSLSFLRLHDSSGVAIGSFIDDPFGLASGIHHPLVAVEPGATYRTRVTAPFYLTDTVPEGWSVALDPGACPAVMIGPRATFEPRIMNFESEPLTTPIYALQ